jgi:hypothetical protein
MTSNTLLRASSLIRVELLITLETVPAETSLTSSLCITTGSTLACARNSANAGPENETE